MMTAARRSAPWLTFFPVLYYHDMFGASAILPAFRTHVDGVIFPYFGHSDGKIVPGNTVDVSRAIPQGENVGALLKCPDRTACTQVHFPGLASAPGRPDSAAMTSRLTSSASKARSLSLSLLDDSGITNSGAATLEVRVGGAVVKTLPTESPGWSRFGVDLTSSTAGKESVEVEIKVTRTGSPVGSLLLTDVQLAGFAEHDTWSTEHLNPGHGVHVTRFDSIRHIFVTYTIPLSAEGGIGASPAYVTTVLSSIERLRGRSLVDGSLVFNLPLPGSRNWGNPANYCIVQQTYGRWR